MGLRAVLDGPAGRGRLPPDGTLPARRWLHAVYYAQQRHRRDHKRWATTLEELGVAPPTKQSSARPTLQVTADLFQAAVDLRRPDGTSQRWNIRQDSLIWPD